ncbi:MAG: RNA polymerase sigma-70 factor [Bacteroidota bacterium]
MLSDEELDRIVKGLGRDDKKALDELYQYYYPRLYGLSKGFLKVEDDIDDILQDVFVKIWLNRRKINSVETFNSWIFTIAKNAILSYFREKTRYNEFETRVQHLATAEVVLNSEVEYEDLKKQTDKIIANLPEKRKEIFLLSREEGMSYKEISEKLGISIKTVEDHMLHALRYLREQFKGFDILTLLYISLFF